MSPHIRLSSAFLAISSSARQARVITDPKQINDPLSEALAAVANEVQQLKQQVRELQGREFAPSDGDRLREIIEIDFQI